MVKVRFGKDCDTQLVVGSTTGCWLCFIYFNFIVIYICDRSHEKDTTRFSIFHLSIYLTKNTL